MEDESRPKEDNHAKLMELHHRIVELDKLEIERERAAKKLKQIENKMHKMFDRADGVVAVVQDRLIKYVNSKIEQLIGYTPKEVINTSFAHYVDPRLLPDLAKYYLKRIAGEDIPNIYETVIKHKDGSDVHIEIMASVVKYQGRLADLAIVRKLSNRAKLNEATE